MGGFDQWGNIISGMEFICCNFNEKVYVVIMLLLIKVDGSKFGKFVEGNIWLDEEFIMFYQFYQFWINVVDIDVFKFICYFILYMWEEIEVCEVEYVENLQEFKCLLVEELIICIYFEEAYCLVFKVMELFFN